MGIVERVEDAELLWSAGRMEGALLQALVAVDATARRKFPSEPSGRRRFERVLREARLWRLSVEFRGKQVPVEELLYRWVRCELVHDGELPVDLVVLDNFEPHDLAVRAGGKPEYQVRLSPGWFHHLIDVVKADPINTDLFPRSP